MKKLKRFVMTFNGNNHALVITHQGEKMIVYKDRQRLTCIASKEFQLDRTGDLGVQEFIAELITQRREDENGEFNERMQRKPKRSNGKGSLHATSGNTPGSVDSGGREDAV